MSNETTTVETTKEVPGTTSFSFNKPRPMWAVWFFRIEFLLNKAALIILGGTTLMKPEHIKETVLWIAAIDFFCWGLSHSLGVDKKQIEADVQQ